ncbi:MAG: DUF2920 family protein [Armatimonadetes bacterium]|nr:DUF2920 family protein [Armatimonadota bacterium]
MLRLLFTLSLCIAVLAAADKTWIVKNGECPWHDRVGRYVIGNLPEKYASEKPVPWQSCNEPRKVVLPDEKVDHVFIAIASSQSKQFADSLNLEFTGDTVDLMDPAGKKVLITYDILLYRNPPPVTEFPGATAGVMLLSWPGEAADQANEEAPASEAKTYTPGEKAIPWHDRVGRWVMVDVPAGIIHGKKVPQQSCTARDIVLPGDALDAVMVGISDTDIEKLPAAVKTRMTDTGADFTIQDPSGGRKLPYSIFVYESPDQRTEFPDFAAGLVLLALEDLSAKLATREAPTLAIKEGRKQVLEPEQQFAGQEWPFQPGERFVKMHVEEPPQGISENTGLMLCLHNWGGIYNQDVYLKWCRTFAERFNVIAVSVNYLQSGDTEPGVLGEKPYDHGYLQAMDCLRALYHIQQQLKEAGVTINPRRCYSMGGSGGGNVTLMVNKLAPHTFACVVDICGMPGLTDGIAFGTGEYGSHLNAGYSKDPQSPAYLTKDMQEIRDPGHPEHLKIAFAANPTNKVVIVHGQDDLSCPVVHKITIFRNMVDAGFRPDGHFLTQWHVDGEAVTSTGHAVGDREKVVIRFADEYMKPDGAKALQVPGPTDFELAGQVVFPTSGGRFVVDYSGVPEIRFEKAEAE